MKKYITALMLITALTGCDHANKMVEQAKDAASTAADSIQKQVDAVDLSKFNVEQFGHASDSVKKLTQSVADSLNIDFNNMDAVTKAKDKIANAYSCLSDLSSESTAEKFMNNISASLKSKEAESLIDKGIEKAKAGYKCVM